MRISTLLGALCFALALPGGAWAQSSQTRTQTTPTSATKTDTAGPEAELWELVLGGTGNSNSQSHSGSQFSGQAFLGYYLTEAFQLNFRQGFTYSNPQGGSRNYDNSSRLALDWMIGHSNVVPFIGGNGGVNYGSGIRDSWILSPEAGIKWWIRPEVFLMALGEYQLTYRSGESNVFVYTFGVGYNW